MSIRGKIILVVLPLVVTPLLFAGLIAVLLARNGITGVATRFLQFKAEQVAAYAEGQWNLLRENHLDDRPEFHEAAVEAVATYADSVMRSQTEYIFAVDPEGAQVFAAGERTPVVAPVDRGPAPLLQRVGALEWLAALDRSESGDAAAESQADRGGGLARTGWGRLSLAGIPRVSYAVAFEPFGWTIHVTEHESAFYASTWAIVQRVGMVLVVSISAGLLLLVILSGYLTRPLRHVVLAMRRIIETNDLSQRVDVLYNDETGTLAHTFNLMTDQLERAYDHIKAYALRAATAKLKEQKTRTMFQKYVPIDVIEQFFANPEKMLVGENRIVSILFSDIRDFTTISEMMQPDVLVETLNRYFTVMVDAIMSHHGIVDKYIGDAIMALFGTPEKRDDDARQSAYAAFDMVDALKDFNLWQERRELPPFRIGVALNYGLVTVGNIGTERKLDYTVIGDMVNVAARLEGLTKKYRVPIIVSESVQRKLEQDIEAGRIASRLLDTVQVKGRAGGLRIYAIARSLDPKRRDAWEAHNEAMDLFYRREFVRARERFSAARALLRGDAPTVMMERRCVELLRAPPGEGWTGIVEMVDK